MTESVIVNTPILWLVFGIALFITMLDLVRYSGGHALVVTSLALVVGGTTYSLVLGASLYEAATVILVFFALELSAFVKKGGEK